jgi:predicted metal-dependent phosphoesterase TrpH
MRRKVEPLLCHRHAHTRWSDGALTLPELVDLYGQKGFDVFCVTDHVNRSDDP